MKLAIFTEAKKETHWGPDFDGDVTCGDQFPKLTTMVGIGLPAEAPRDFECGENELTSLEGAPSIVNGDVNATENRIASLKDIHKVFKKITGVAHGGRGGEIDLRGNPIKSHVLGLLKIEGLKRVIIGFINLANGGNAENKRKVKAHDIINKHLAGDRNLLVCQEELMDAGLEEFAQL